MNNSMTKRNFSIQSYIDENREKIDEALVSLRLMKEIDWFLDLENISNKKLAEDLGYSESFISQLMSGVKKANVSFINKFEKKYNAKINFSLQIQNKNLNSQLNFLQNKEFNSKLNFVFINTTKISKVYIRSSNNNFEIPNTNDYFEIPEYEILDK